MMHADRLAGSAGPRLESLDVELTASNMPMRLNEFLNADFVLPRLAARDVDGIVREVAERAGGAEVASPALIEEKLLERERVHPTVIGSGLAIPHAVIPGLSKPVVGVALAREPVQFGPETLEPVRLFFVLLSPPGHESQHVKLLGRLCRLVRHEDFIDRLLGAADDAAILEVVESVDALHV